MSDTVGAKGIAAVQRGDVDPKPGARVFTVRGSGGGRYVVALGALPPSDFNARGDFCSCPAGQAARRCYHVVAARLSLGRLFTSSTRERDPRAGA